MMCDFPEYSIEGKLGLSVVHQYWAHATIYCEDESHETFYDRLIRRIIPNIKDCLIVCLGGKSEILKALKTSKNKTSMPEIFIVDKDYDDFVGDLGRNKYKNLIYLRKHSIENYLSQIDAVLEIALEQKSGSKITRFMALQKMANHTEYYDKLVKQLIKIGRYYIVARKNNIPVKTSKISCSDIYLESNNAWPLPTDEWIDQYIEEFRKQCESNHEWLLQEDFLENELSNAFIAKDTPWGVLPEIDHVVGKHLLGGVIRYVDYCMDTKIIELKDVELYTRLVSYINTDQFEYLRSDILGVAPMLVKK